MTRSASNDYRYWAIASHRRHSAKPEPCFASRPFGRVSTIASLYAAGKCRWGDRQRTGPMVSVLLPRSRGGCGVQRCGDHTLAGVPQSNAIRAFCIAIATFTAAWFAAHFISAAGQL